MITVQDRAQESGIGYLPNRSPTGHHLATLVTRDDDGPWSCLLDDGRCAVPEGETIYDTKGAAFGAARERWGNSP